MSRILYQDQWYCVCVTKAGLTIQNKKTSKGKLYERSHPQFAEMLESFDTAIDKYECLNLAQEWS